jgi:hypothetical protein
MRWVFVAAVLAACGGQILDEPGDGGDAGKDAAADATLDAVVDAPASFDVVGNDDIAMKNTCAMGTQALLAYYPLDQDTHDHSGHGFDAVGTNLAATTGIVGGAMLFDGVGSKLRVASGNAFLSGPRTLCAWNLGKPTNGLGQPLFWGGAPQAGDFYSLFAFAPNGGTCPNAPPGVPFVDHWGTPCYFAPLPPALPQWNLVCYAFDGAAFTFFSDGAVAPPMPGALYDYPMTSLFIGSTLGNGTTTVGSFTGAIDEATVWSKALTGPEMMALWNSGAGCAVE